jgi:purine-cytosine permease-like protein
MRIEESNKYNFFDLTSIVMSGVISTPALMIGFLLTKNQGFASSIIAIIIGNSILALIAIPIALASQKSKKNSSEMTEQFLGPYGAKLSACSLMLVLSGWFAINLRIVADLVSNKDNYILINLLLGLAICIFVIGGIDRIKSIGKYVIILFAVSVTITFLSKLETATNTNLNISNLNSNLMNKEALLIIIASSFAVIFDLPTYHRFSKSKKDSIISIILGFIGIIIVETLGASLSLISDAENISKLFMSVDNKLFYMINITFILIAGFSVSSSNLYVAAANLNIVTPNIVLSKRITCIGSFSILLSFFDIMGNFSLFLNAMMILLASITSLLFLNCLNRDRNKENETIAAALFSIFIGLLIGFLSLTKTIELFDCAFIEAAITTGIIYKAILKTLNITTKKHRLPNE